MAGVEKEVVYDVGGAHTTPTTPTAPNVHPQPAPSGGPLAFPYPASPPPGPTTVWLLPAPLPERRLCDAYILAVLLGFFGAHHFYLRRPGWGVLYLCTAGLFGVGYLVDIVRVPVLVREANTRAPGPRKTLLSDAYLIWFPFGILGAHQYYLGRILYGLLYTFTLGLFGVGWLLDLCLMPRLVRATNKRVLGEQYDALPGRRHLGQAYVLCLFPLTGLLGGHHYYLGRYGFGALYTCTFGLLGIGWLVDICRLSCLVNRINREMEEGKTGRAYLDDAYLCAFPLGFLGLHHFYLRRPGWGVLYLCTFGVLGIGWVIDWFRLPCLVSDHNKTLGDTEERVRIIAGTQAVVPGYSPSSAPPAGQVGLYHHQTVAPLPGFRPGPQGGYGTVSPPQPSAPHGFPGYANAPHVYQGYPPQPFPGDRDPREPPTDPGYPTQPHSREGAGPPAAYGYDFPPCPPSYQEATAPSQDNNDTKQ